MGVSIFNCLETCISCIKNLRVSALKYNEFSSQWRWCHLFWKCIKVVKNTFIHTRLRARMHAAWVYCIWLTWNSLGPAGSEPGCRHSGTLCSGTAPPRGQTNPVRNICLISAKRKKNWVTTRKLRCCKRKLSCYTFLPFSLCSVLRGSSSVSNNLGFLWLPHPAVWRQGDRQRDHMVLDEEWQ